MKVTASRLTLGDYLVDDRVLIERKTLQDLALSLADGRLFSQACRLVESKYHPLIIIEGASIPASGMSRESIQGALITLTLILGIPCLRSFDTADTANLIRYVAGQVNRDIKNSIHRHGYRPKRRRKRQLYILQGLPGIGPSRAEQLLATFGSVAAVFNASADELACVPCIGDKTAAAIRDIIGPDQIDRAKTARPI